LVGEQGAKGSFGSACVFAEPTHSLTPPSGSLMTLAEKAHAVRTREDLVAFLESFSADFAVNGP
jgi:hypothetical protein